MGWCKKDITPLLTHGSYIFLALTHQYSLALKQWYDHAAPLSSLDMLCVDNGDTTVLYGYIDIIMLPALSTLGE